MHIVLGTLDYLITVGYGITVLGGHLLQKNKRMVWNNRIGWKKSQKIINIWGGIIVYWVEIFSIIMKFCKLGEKFALS